MKQSENGKNFDIRGLIRKYDGPVFKLHGEVYLRHGIRPKLVSLLTCDDPGSISYVKGMRRFAAEQGVLFENFDVGSREDLETRIRALNEDPSVHGIIVLYPSCFDVRDTYFMNLVAEQKDVEGLNYGHLGYLVQFEKFSDPQKLRKLVIPPTPKGILYLFKRSALDFEEARARDGRYPEGFAQNPFIIEGKRITIINDSLAVGRSMALMFLNENGSVRVCQEHTAFSDILEFVKTSDFIISAVPSDDFCIPAQAVPAGAIVIDISFAGNFEYPAVFEKAFRIAPRWNLVEKGNRINDLTLYRLISNLFYLINRSLPDDVLMELGGG
jgi:5,10-methylene-tetrahydrofolate dehydrogenase/methenyl tetrahydrofolate cyclohydrolase